MTHPGFEGVDPAERMRFVSLTHGTAQFVDEQTGVSAYVPRSGAEALPRLLTGRLQALARRALRLGAPPPPPAPDAPEGADAPLTDAQRADALLAIVAEAERIAGVDPGLAPGASYAAGLAARTVGDFERAYRHWAAFTGATPAYVGGFLELTICALETDRLEEALGAARRAVELAPRHAGALANLGQVLLATGALDEAGTFITRSLEVAPEDPITRQLQAAHAKAVAERGPAGA